MINTQRTLPRPDGADALEEGRGGLVGRVLRDELAAEGALADGAAKRGAARESEYRIMHG